MILKDIVQVDIMAQDIDVSSHIEKAIAYGEGINYARELADTPSNLMTPDTLVDEAIKLVKNIHN